MIILAIDCAASLCAACVYDAAADRELGREVRDLGKGHAEHLMDVIAEALRASGMAYSDLGAVAVSVGPGSFTGIRVGVAAARGLALALRVPAISITTLEAIAAETRMSQGDIDVLAAIDAGRDGIYIASYAGTGKVRHGPSISTLEEAAELARRENLTVSGSAARKILQLPAGESLLIGIEGATADIAMYARLAAAKGPAAERPKPLYLRAPDAKPQAGFVLPRRDG